MFRFKSAEFSGHLEESPLAEVVGAIARAKATGTLAVEKPGDVRTLHLREGEIKLATSSRPEQRLGAFLRNRGQLTEALLADALEEAKTRPGVYFGDILLERGAIDAETLRMEVRRLVERIVQLTFPWTRGTFRFTPSETGPDTRVSLEIDTRAVVFDGVARLPESEIFLDRLGDPAAIPTRRPKLIPPFRPASPNGLFLAQVDGRASCGELVAAGPGNPAHAAKLLYGFRCAGWVRWPDEGGSDSFDRKRLEETYRRIDWINHYEVLGVPSDADDAAVRRAAEEARDAIDGSPELADTGLLRRIQLVSRRILEAEEVLTDRHRRAAYDRELTLGPVLASANDRGDAALRREMAVSSYRRAQQLIRDRDYYPAVKMLEQAVRWAPDVAEYRYLLGVTQRRNPMWKERAAEHLREAARLDPDRSDIAVALADALLDRKPRDPLPPPPEEPAAAVAPEGKSTLWTRLWNREGIRELEERTRELELQHRELAAANESLKQLSLVDGLTGIGNRRRFDAALAQEWVETMKLRLPLTIVMIDVDHFKAFNDSRGHQSGDQYLQKVARALADSLQREQDVLARYGGEEFAIILRPSGPAEAANVAESFRARIERLRLPHPASPAGPVLTVSVGVATATPRAGFSPSALVLAADEALYRSKNEGRNRVTVVDNAF